MTFVTLSFRSFNWSAIATAVGVLAMLGLSSCTSSSPQIAGVPGTLERIALHGNARTPSHSMPRSRYPFDANGNYVTSWAAEGGGYIAPPRSSGSSRVKKVPSIPTKSNDYTGWSWICRWLTKKRVCAAAKTLRCVRQFLLRLLQRALQVRDPHDGSAESRRRPGSSPRAAGASRSCAARPSGGLA